jgi:hypothetical protein
VSILEGIDKILAPQPVAHAYVSYLVLGASLVFEGAVWIMALRKFREVKGRRGWFEAVRLSKDPTTFTVLFEDTAAILGILIAFAGIGLGEWLRLPLLDGVASLLIGLTLGLISALLAYECQSLTTGEGVSPEVRSDIQQLVESEEVVRRVNEMLTEAPPPLAANGMASINGSPRADRYMRPGASLSEGSPGRSAGPDIRSAAQAIERASHPCQAVLLPARHALGFGNGEIDRVAFPCSSNCRFCSTLRRASRRISSGSAKLPAGSSRAWRRSSGSPCLAMIILRFPC